jgi:hypothetical protein
LRQRSRAHNMRTFRARIVDRHQLVAARKLTALRKSAHSAESDGCHQPRDARTSSPRNWRRTMEGKKKKGGDRRLTSVPPHSRALGKARRRSRRVGATKPNVTPTELSSAVGEEHPHVRHGSAEFVASRPVRTFAESSFGGSVIGCVIPQRGLGDERAAARGLSRRPSHRL